MRQIPSHLKVSSIEIEEDEKSLSIEVYTKELNDQLLDAEVSVVAGYLDRELQSIGCKPTRTTYERGEKKPSSR